ncbi:MAG: hypothetical protein NZ822_02345, partial [Patescibacteria group bacterium]|nr:hypothetical protein [Patescibacteria group bacterium]
YSLLFSNTFAQKGGSMIWAVMGTPENGAYVELKDMVVDDAAIYSVGKAIVHHPIYLSDGYTTYKEDDVWYLEKRDKFNGKLVYSKIINFNRLLKDRTDFEVIEGIALNDAIYIVGVIDEDDDKDQPTKYDKKWRIEKRAKENGELIWYRESDHRGEASEIVVDDSYIYLVGTEIDNRPIWRVEKRKQSDGSLVWVTTSSEIGYAQTVTLDKNFVYVGGSGGDSETNRLTKNDYGGYEIWKVKKFDKNSGRLIWAKGAITNGHAIVNSLDIDESSIYAVGVESDTPHGENHMWRIEKRSIADGSIIWVKFSDPTKPTSIVKDSDFKIGGSDWVGSVKVQGDYIYIGGSEEEEIGRERWRIEKRDKNNGNLIWARRPDYSFFSDVVTALTADSSGVYVGGKTYVRGKEFLSEINSYQRIETFRIEKRRL